MTRAIRRAGLVFRVIALIPVLLGCDKPKPPEDPTTEKDAAETAPSLESAAQADPRTDSPAARLPEDGGGLQDSGPPPQPHVIGDAAARACPMPPPVLARKLSLALCQQPSSLVDLTEDDAEGELSCKGRIRSGVNNKNWHINAIDNSLEGARKRGKKLAQYARVRLSSDCFSSYATELCGNADYREGKCLYDVHVGVYRERAYDQDDNEVAVGSVLIMIEAIDQVVAEAAAAEDSPRLRLLRLLCGNISPRARSCLGKFKTARLVRNFDVIEIQGPERGDVQEALEHEIRTAKLKQLGNSPMYENDDGVRCVAEPVHRGPAVIAELSESENLFGTVLACHEGVQPRCIGPTGR